MKRSFCTYASGAAFLLPLATLMAGCGGGSGGPRATPTATATPTGTATPTATTTPTTSPGAASVNFVFSQLGANAPADTSPLTRADFSSGNGGFVGRNGGYTLASFQVQQGGTGFNAGTSNNEARIVEVRINAGRQLQAGNVFPIQVPTAANTNSSQPSNAAFVVYRSNGTTGQSFNSTFTTQGTVAIESVVGTMVALRINNASLSMAPPQPASFVLDGRFTVPNVSAQGPN